MSACRWLGATLSALLLSFAGDAAAGEVAPSSPQAAAAPASFALVVGSNLSVDPELAPLKYADDDAARYFDLFRLLGARTYLLARLDDNTRRLHPQAAAEAVEPRRAQLERAVSQLAADVVQASARNVRTVVYVVYAGHGNVKDGQGYLTLEDARVTGTDLAEIVRRIPATRVHVIADACASYFLAHARGPGGQRRPLAGFRSSALADDPRVGLLLSTSSARESHEWDAFQSGVFSHEVRSGLYGAADADGDGVVSYSEIAAFVARAGSAVPNEKYRPEVYARPPGGSETLLEIRGAILHDDALVEREREE
ncbi:MAG TPA: caspase family protein, partial [Labilithrix sp.]|nr:caspase family protein [Labilithrix sp.]